MPTHKTGAQNYNFFRDFQILRLEKSPIFFKNSLRYLKFRKKIVTLPAFTQKAILKPYLKSNPMRELKITSCIHACSYEELSADRRELVDAAKAMIYRSYSPYSGFAVGAALRMSDGSIHGGANQENAAYPSGLCAERTALFSANAQYPDLAVRAIAIAAFTAGNYTDKPISPCGACRQVMLETENRYGGKMEVILYGQKQIYIIDSVADLLPLTFLKEDLLG